MNDFTAMNSLESIHWNQFTAMNSVASIHSNEFTVMTGIKSLESMHQREKERRPPGKPKVGLETLLQILKVDL